jgi:Domain of unknown function DUF11/Beta-propeller repeat
MLKAARIFPAAIVVLLATVATLFAQNSHPPSITAPLAFEANRGQTAPQVQYLARSREGVVFLTRDGFTVSLPHQGSFRMLFDQASSNPVIGAEQPLIARSNYLSRDPEHSIVNVENFAAVHYRSVYPGIDVRFYGQGMHLEHDFLLAPGADAGQITLRLDGIDHASLGTSGTVELALGKIKLSESAPVAWQMINGTRQPVQAQWRLLSENHLGISVGAYDRNLPLTIDPVLAYSTHIGGTTEQDQSLGTTEPAFTVINNIALDSARNVYISGTTSAIDYPTTAGAFDRTPNTQAEFHGDTFSSSGFVSKFDKTGRTLIYSTFLHAGIEKMAVGSEGHVYTAEFADDANPGPNEGGSDPGIFVDKLSLDGSRLLYSIIYARTTNTSTACQAFGDSFPSSLAADGVGHLWMVGDTANPCIPSTPGVVEPTLNPANGGGFLTKLDTTKAAAASIVYTTYVGGQSGANVNSVVVDSAGNAYVAGNAPASYPHTKDFGTDNAAGQFSTFVTKFNPTATARVFSSMIHGSSGIAVGIDPSLNVYVAGNAGPGGFPTTNGAFQTTARGTNCNSANPCFDNFVSKLNPTGSLLLYSTYVGGTGTETLAGLQVNSVGMAFITGGTTSQDYPITTNAPDKTPAPSGESSAFVTALAADAKSLVYSTYLSGATTNANSSFKTAANSIFVDTAFNAWVAGVTDQSDFPVAANAFQPGKKGSADGFFSELIIAGDLKVTLGSTVGSVAKNGNVILTGSVFDLGPDGSDAVVFKEAIPAGYKFQGVSTNATSCTKPAAGATSGTVTCTKTRLESGQHFFVNVFVQAIAASGSNITSKATASARTQDLSQTNNSASATVHVK